MFHLIATPEWFDQTAPTGITCSFIITISVLAESALVMLNSNLSFFENSVDPDQTASEEAM